MGGEGGGLELGVRDRWIERIPGVGVEPEGIRLVRCVVRFMAF